MIIPRSFRYGAGKGMPLEPFYVLHSQLQYGLLKKGLHRSACSLQQATVHYEMMAYMSMSAALLFASKLKNMSTMHRHLASHAVVGSPPMHYNTHYHYGSMGVLNYETSHLILHGES